MLNKKAVYTYISYHLQRGGGGRLSIWMFCQKLKIKSTKSYAQFPIPHNSPGLLLFSVSTLESPVSLHFKLTSDSLHFVL